MNRIEYDFLYGRSDYAGQDLVLAKPLTFMNESGRAVRQLLKKFPVSLSELLVVYDDLDLDMGEVRMRQVASGGSHKGIKSILAHLGGGGFSALRIGINPPQFAIDDRVHYVLAPVAAPWRELYREGLQRAVSVLETFVMEGRQAAMNLFNRKKNPLLLEKEAVNNHKEDPQ